MQPNVITYNALISACEKGGQWDTAVAVFKRMLLNDVQPNVRAHAPAHNPQLLKCAWCRNPVTHNS